MKKRLLCLALCVLLLLPAAVGCSSTVAVDLPIVEDGKAMLYICMPKEHTAQTLYARDRLVFFVRAQTGVTLESGTAAKMPSGAPVLYLGDCGAALSAELAERLEGEEKFYLAAEGQEIAVVADSEAFLYDAVDYLIAHMSGDADGKTLTLQGELEELGRAIGVQIMAVHEDIFNAMHTV